MGRCFICAMLAAVVLVLQMGLIGCSSGSLAVSSGKTPRSARLPPKPGGP